MGRACFFVAVLMVASSALAQATPSSRLQWDQNDTDAGQLEYWLSVDGGNPGLLAGVSCTNDVPAVCNADLPPLIPGPHSLVLVARRTVSGTTFDSLPSTPLDIVFAAFPATPEGLRLSG